MRAETFVAHKSGKLFVGAAKGIGNVNSVQVWDWRTGKHLGHIPHTPGHLCGMCLVGDRYLAVASCFSGSVIELFDIETQTLIRSRSVMGYVECIAWSGVADEVMITTAQHMCHIWQPSMVR